MSAEERSAATLDYTPLAEALRMLTIQMAPKALDPKAQEAIAKHAALVNSLRSVFRDATDTSTTQY